MIFDHSAGESQSIKLRADGKVSMATSGSSGFVADLVVSRHRSKGSAPTRRVRRVPLADVVYEDQWGQPYRNH
jgi:hypothetical protein